MPGTATRMNILNIRCILDKPVIVIRMFILQTIGGFSDDGTTGGGVLHLVGLANEWLKLGNEVHFISNTSDQGKRVYSHISNLYHLPSYGHSFLIDMFVNFKIQKKFLESIIKTSLDNGTGSNIIVAASPYTSDVLAAFYISHRFKLPAVVYFHHLSLPPWHHPLKRGGFVRTTINWALNQMALTLAKLGGMIPAIDHPIEITDAGWRFSNGVLRDDNALPLQNAENLQQDKEFEACFIGRIAINKGVVDLMNIWRIVCTSKPLSKMVIAGKLSYSSLGKKLHKLRKKLKLESNVTFIFRHITEEAKHDILCRSKLFLFPSYEEGWSLSVMESAAYGILPITYDLAAYNYLGPKAVKAKPGDIEGFARKTIKFLDETDNRIKLASDLRERVMAFRLPDIAEYQLKKFEQFIRYGRIID